MAQQQSGEYLQQIHKGFLFHIGSQLATVHGKCHDQPQHIAQLFHSRKLPVIATATAAHDPGEEGGRYAWTTDNRGEGSTICERIPAKTKIGVERIGQPERGEPATVRESRGTNIF